MHLTQEDRNRIAKAIQEAVKPVRRDVADPEGTSPTYGGTSTV